VLIADLARLEDLLEHGNHRVITAWYMGRLIIVRNHEDGLATARSPPRWPPTPTLVEAIPTPSSTLGCTSLLYSAVPGVSAWNDDPDLLEATIKYLLA
jgi:hypothetical protein